VGGRAIPDALSECASRLEERWTGKLASALAGYYGGRADVAGKWAEALKDTAKDSEEAASLTADDRQVIALFGDQLSSPDIRTIGENYAMLYARIGEKLQESDRDRAVKGRLYRTLGTLAGLAAAVVVL
jgi:stage III sporulation protein AB